MTSSAGATPGPTVIGTDRDSDHLVSIVVPCRNERDHVGAFATSALAQVLPDGWRLEIVIADGGSDDGTAEALVALVAAQPRVRVVANPRRIVSAGLNAALAATRGSVVVRMDVHTTYASDYVAECLATLARTGADNVGGPWRAEATPAGGAMQAAIAAAFQSRWVAGGALSRRLNHDGPVDTVYLGAWPRATFDRFGGFDESLVRNQDDEHNLRIVRGGGRIWQSPRIRSAYRPRARLAQVFRQYRQYGYWKPFVMSKLGQPASPRHVVPAVFVVALGFATVLAVGAIAAALAAGHVVAAAMLWPFAALVVAYGAAVALLTAGVAASA
ncbi:MAG: glycosyltransferase family 2 protein [Caldimonas sp.]